MTKRATKDETRVMTDPARRLAKIMAIFRSKASDNGQAIMTVWAETLGVPSADRSALLRGIAEVNELVAEIRARVEAEPNIEADFLLHHYSHVEAWAGETNLSAAVGNVVGHLDDQVIRDVQFISMTMPSTWAEVPIEQDELALFLADVEELDGWLRAAAIDEEVRTVLLGILEAMRHAVVRYRTAGADAFKTALTRATGELFMYRDDVQAAVEADPTVTGFNRLLLALGRFVQQARPVVGLLKESTQLFLLGRGDGSAGEL